MLCQTVGFHSIYMFKLKVTDCLYNKKPSCR